MTKAVLFDWYNTLSHYYPPREQLQANACREMGIKLAEDRLPAGLLLADHYYITENARYPMKGRPLEEQMNIYAQMQRIALREAGATDVSDQLALGILQKVGQAFSNRNFAVFDDVLPAFDWLKRRGLILGIISNIDRELATVCQQLGLAPYIDLTITSLEVGTEKPHPGIFLAALERAGVEASQAIYIGDHYDTDIVGAQKVGMKGILLDRYDLFPEVTACPRVKSLGALSNHL